MSSPNVDTEDKVIWIPTTEGILIRIMHEHVKKGDMQTSTFTKKVWGVIADELYTEVGTRFTTSQLKSKFNRLRKKHREFSDLIKHTGFSWDPISCTVTAPDDVWKEYIQVHLGARAYMKKGLDQYDILCEIFNTSTATGDLRYSSTQLQREPEEEHDIPENFVEPGGQTNPVDDDEIFDMMMRTPVGKGSRGKRPRRASGSVEPPPPAKRASAREHFWNAATEFISDQNARVSASSLQNTCGESTFGNDCFVTAVLEAAQRLQDIEDDVLYKLCDKATESVEWRQAFLALADDKKLGYLRRL